MSNRPNARQRLYDRNWDVARREFLTANPWCAWCRRDGLLKPAKHVHHSTPHRGNPVLFWDRTRWVSLCQTHHNADAQQIERRGYASRVDASGLPTDPNHPFNRASSAETEAAHPQTGGRSKVQRSRGAGPVGELGTELVSPKKGSR